MCTFKTLENGESSIILVKQSPKLKSIHNKELTGKVHVLKGNKVNRDWLKWWQSQSKQCVCMHVVNLPVQAHHQGNLFFFFGQWRYPTALKVAAVVVKVPQH